MAEEVFVFPTSFAQQRLWFLDQLDPGSTLYNLPMAVRLHGLLDRDALEQTFGQIVRRHEVLRTTFSVMDGQPVQVITSADAESLPFLDLSHLPLAEREAEARRLASEDARQPFDLIRGPLFRVRLVKLEETDHVLLLTMHHIISDGWSKSVLTREIRTLYEAFSHGRPSPLPELPIQYADFALWQRERLQGEVLASELHYWKSKLEGAATLDLPADRPRPALQTFRGADYFFTLPESLTLSLREVGQGEGVTLFMTLLAAFQVLLSRYSGQEDISVGTAVAGRNRAETEHLIGLFINTLALRTDLTGDPDFIEVLRRVREVCLGAYAHQDVPFEKLVEELAPERDLSRSPLFQVMFALQNVPREDLSLSGLSLSPVETSSGMSRFDLSLSMIERGDELRGMVEYNTDLFDAATIERMMGHFQTLLASIAADPRRPVKDLPLLTAPERQRIISEWNNTAQEFPLDKCIHELFAEQVALTPDEVAVVFEDRQLTYRELDRRSNQLAHYLRELGVGPETLVGLCMDRALEMVVGLLGILKAGGAYLPLDPSYPHERLIFMLEDSGAAVLLTQENLRGLLATSQVKEVALNTDWDLIAERSEERPVSLAEAQNLAYVIYTSGSTGRPKGVMIAHRNVSNFFTAMDERLGTESKGVWLALTSISFDISVLELFWTLTRGFKVVIQSEHVVANYTVEPRYRVTERGMEFSLFYFASNGTDSDTDRYRLLTDGARFADQHGFKAIWTPERHFHAFGDLYPNPAITSAALSTITERLEIRAGSVVSPLHHPVRVAEEWAMVDNLSKGRVGVSFASGWHAADFIFAPENYPNRRQLMLEQIEQVRKLWRGEKVKFMGGAGQEVEVGILPRPVQPELPVWVTSGGSPDTFRKAGEIGANLLTHLLGQRVPELGEKIQLYREAWRNAGHPSVGHVTLMLHTFVGDDIAQVKETVREPFTNYLASSVDLIKNLAQSLGIDPAQGRFTDDDMQTVLEHAFNRYYKQSGLMGTPEVCLEMVERLKGIDVDEVACLIDFGVNYEAVMQSLSLLDEVRRRSNEIKEKKQYSIAAQLQHNGVTHLQCTPSLASLMSLDEETMQALGGLRKLLLGGEALPVPLARQLSAAVAGEVHNMYGPTETTVWSATHLVNDEESRIPIGRPIANTEIYILSEKLEVVPVGVAGEVYIGGAGVVRGYLNRAELSAERFIPDPFSATPGARLYRTGDMARYLPDGEIDFVGRADQQVKVRGYRIELGEVEATLRQYPGVRDVAVVVREDKAGEKQLVAFVASDNVPELASTMLRNYLKKRLPDYMIPTAWVRMDALPLTPNAKVDVRALPEPERDESALTAEHLAPRTLTEELVAGIWREVLRTERLGINDNFFDLGGHSLLATRVITQVRETFNIDLPLRRLFDNPTVAKLSESIEQARQQANGLLVPAIQRVAREGALPVTFSQENRLLRLRQEVDRFAPNPMANRSLVYRLKGSLKVELLERSLNETIRRHENLRTIFTEVEGRPAQTVLPELSLTLSVLDLQELDETLCMKEALRIAQEESLRRFDAFTGPLMRATLLTLAEDDHIVIMVMDHLIFDDWSANVLMNEVTTFYGALADAKQLTLPALEIQYADYAHWQRTWLDGETLKSYVAYWERHFDGRDPYPALQLPGAHTQLSAGMHRSRTQTRVIPATVLKAVKNLTREQGSTLYMTLLAAFKILFNHYTGQERIGIVSPVANRQRLETQALIGWFANTQVFHTNLAGDPSFREVLERVRQVTLGVYEHPDIPFDTVRELIHPTPPDTPLEQKFRPYVFFSLTSAELSADGAPGEQRDGLLINAIGLNNSVTTNGITIHALEQPEELALSIEYQAERYDDQLIARFMEHYQALLEDLAARPDTRLSEWSALKATGVELLDGLEETAAPSL
jgi:natural product biosynthesis luciferase-like monooxygenase protein